MAKRRKAPHFELHINGPLPPKAAKALLKIVRSLYPSVTGQAKAAEVREPEKGGEPR